MTIEQAFPPVTPAHPRVLVLGSMPGVASLRAGQYYAHPRNAFWFIMGRMFGATPELPYAQRLACLKQHHIALWDVIHRCCRPGSLDTAIDPASVQANDFNAFLRRHRSLRAICFNGASVEALFRRHALPAIDPALLPALVRLPSTSPANARLGLEEKARAWAVIREFLE